MDWQLFALNSTVGFLFRETTRKEEADWDQDAIAEAKEGAIVYVKMLDAHLANRPFVAGENLTMGDIPVGFFINRWQLLDIEHPALENLHAWHDRLKARPGYKTHITENGL